MESVKRKVNKRKFVNLTLQKKIYDKQTIHKVIDIVSNEYTVIVKDKKTHFILSIFPKYKDFINKNISKIFIDHLNNQNIRDIISKDSNKIRELIVSKALFETEAFDNESQSFNLDEYPKKENYMLDKNKITKSSLKKKQ